MQHSCTTARALMMRAALCSYVQGLSELEASSQRNCCSLTATLRNQAYWPAQLVFCTQHSPGSTCTLSTTLASSLAPLQPAWSSHQQNIHHPGLHDSQHTTRAAHSCNLHASYPTKLHPCLHPLLSHSITRVMLSHTAQLHSGPDSLVLRLGSRGPHAGPGH